MMTQNRSAMFGASASTVAALLSLGQALATAFRAITEPLRKYVERANLHEQLMAMDDHQLADIGITRGDIPTVVAGSGRRSSQRINFVAVHDRRPITT